MNLYLGFVSPNAIATLANSEVGRFKLSPDFGLSKCYGSNGFKIKSSFSSENKILYSSPFASFSGMNYSMILSNSYISRMKSRFSSKRISFSRTR